MKTNRLTIIVTIVVALIMSVTDANAGTDSGGNWPGKGTWKPTLNLSEVTVMVNWMADGVLVPCGRNRPKAIACAFPPDKTDIPRQGTLCEITHPGFRSSPTDEELEEFGTLLETCLEQTGTRIVTLRFLYGSNVAIKPTKTLVKALPCGISISRNVSAETKGHEGLHCWRGSWHEKY